MEATQLNKIAVIADIHGRYDLLCNILYSLKINHPNHFIFFLGDLIDRGSQSFEVVSLVKSLCEAGKAKLLIGNHELMMLDFIDGKGTSQALSWFGNGGRETIESYKNNAHKSGNFDFIFSDFADKCGHTNFLRNCDYVYEDDNIFLSHAPIPSKQFMKFELSDLDSWSFINTVTWSWHGDFRGVTESQFARDNGKLSVCGHVHALREGRASARVYHHYIYLDSGCGCHKDAPLSCAIIEDGRLVKIIES